MPAGSVLVVPEFTGSNGIYTKTDSKGNNIPAIAGAGIAGGVVVMLNDVPGKIYPDAFENIEHLYYYGKGMSKIPLGVNNWN